MSRIQKQFTNEIVPKLKEVFKFSSVMQVPRLDKVVLNVGVGKSLKDAKHIEVVENTLIRISGQRPVKTLAKKAISNFKTRKGLVVGLKVTLRGEKMYSFVEKLIHSTFPRIRDFRGLDQKSVDKYGNLNLGFKEHIAFPEIKSDEVEKIHGLQVTVSTTAKNREEGLELFKALGFPFVNTKE